MQFFLLVVLSLVISVSSGRVPFPSWSSSCVSRREESGASPVLQLRGGSNVKHPSSLGAFDDIVKDSGDKLVVVDFSAAWCMPCKMIAPVYDDMSEEECYEDVAFLKVDVDEAPAISERFKVMSMPTFIFLKNGKVVDRFSGASVEKLRETIAKLI